MKKLLITILLAIPLFLIQEQIVGDLKISADTPRIDTASCINVFPDCPTGTRNLYQSIQSGTITFNGWGSTNEFMGKVMEHFNSGQSDPNYYKKVCISTQYTNVITTYEGGTTPSGQIGMHTGVFTTEVAKLCPNGTRPSKTADVGAIPGAWGCCPSGYIFASASNLSLGTELQNQGACCPSGVGVKYYQDGKCKTAGLQEVPGATPLTDEVYKKGVTFGTIDGSTLALASNSITNEQVCAPGFENGCVITTTAVAGADQIPSDATDLQPYITAGTYVASPSVYAAGSTTTAQCVKCVINRAYLGASGDRVMLCDNGKIKFSDTIGGSVDATKGYLLEDSTNQAYYDQCLSTGGIYTAIGCIDPTPTGIITGLVRIALGVMGGVALLQLIYVGILYQQGNMEKIKGARTQLIATLTGIAVLVFSVLILRIIGVNILDVVSNGSV